MHTIKLGDNLYNVHVNATGIPEDVDLLIALDIVIEKINALEEEKVHLESVIHDGICWDVHVQENPETSSEEDIIDDITVEKYPKTGVAVITTDIDNNISFVAENTPEKIEETIDELKDTIEDVSSVAKPNKRGRPRKKKIEDEIVEVKEEVVVQEEQEEKSLTEIIDEINAEATIEDDNEFNNEDEFIEFTEEEYAAADEGLDEETLEIIKSRIDNDRCDGHMVKQIMTPTCTGDLVPTLMATGYDTACYKNFFSVGHFPKPGILEVWETDEPIEENSDDISIQEKYRNTGYPESDSLF